MAARFRSTVRGPAARFSPGEVALLGVLLGELMTLLGTDDESGAPADPLETLTGMSDAHSSGVKPADPVLARLLPDAYPDDAERTAEFRRYTEGDLRRAKRAAAHLVLQSLPAEGGKVVLDERLTEAWLGALNDIRLALGTRLEVTDDTGDEIRRLDPGSRRAQELDLYLWLGWLQETLVDTLL